MAPRAINGLSLCAGIGGLDLGLGLAVPGYRTVGYVERDAYAAATLVARMADQTLDTAPVWDDLSTFDGRPWRGVVDLVIGGYPCQPFSNAGKRLGADDPRHLWPDWYRLIRESRPPAVFGEQSDAAIGHGWLDLVQADLEGLGYTCGALVTPAAGFGAPHGRHRIRARRDSRRPAAPPARPATCRPSCCRPTRANCAPAARCTTS